MARLSSPHIVSYQHVNIVNGIPFAVMDYVRGVPLSALLASSAASDHRVATRIGVTLAEALTAAQDQGFIHRRLTPRHILVGVDGQVQLKGFGQPGGRQPLSISESDKAYLAPRTPATEFPDDRRDLFSLGTIMTHMLLGSPAVDLRGSSPFAVPEALWRLVTSLTAVDGAGVSGETKQVAATLRQFESVDRDERERDAAWSGFLARVRQQIGRSKKLGGERTREP